MWAVQDMFTKFVYPFLFDADTDEAFQAAAARVEEHRAPCDPREEPILMWIESQFHEGEMDNMLPYVKRYVRLPENQRRFVLRPEFITLLRELQTVRQEGEEARFSFSRVELYLFFNGVGFLVFEVESHRSDDQDLPIQWVEDLNADLASLTRGRPVVRRQTPFEGLSLETMSRESIESPSLLSVALGEPVAVRALIEQVWLKPFYSKAGEPQWQPMCDTFLLVYGAILLKQPKQLDPGQIGTTFTDFAAQHVVVLRKTLSSSNSNRFSRQLFGDVEHNYMPYHNVIHTQSLEGGFVLAFDNGAPHFTGPRSSAMLSFRTNYFYMMLLALHQRMSILRYAMEAADAASRKGRAHQLRRLRERIYDFSSRCYFSQASVSEERDQLYRRWQRVFNVSQMYDELKEEIHDIDDYLAGIAKAEELAAREAELRQEAQKTQVISNITFVLLPISIASSVIQAIPVLDSLLNFRESPVRASLILGMMFIIAVAFVWFMRRVLRMKHRDHRSERTANEWTSRTGGRF